MRVCTSCQTPLDAEDLTPPCDDLPSPPLASRFRSLGIAAFGFSAASFGAATIAFSLWRDQARFLEGQPPGTIISGGAAFSLNFIPLITTFVTIFLGAVGSVLLGASCGLARLSPQRVLSGLHITTALLLLPFLYFLAHFVGRITSIYSR